MTTVLAILARLPWRYIGIALAALAVLWGAYHWAYERGARSRDIEVAAITLDRDTYRRNAATLRASLDQQNAAVKALQAAADKRVSDGAAALATVQRDNAKQAGTIASLRKGANNTHYAVGAPCEIDAALDKVEGL